MLDLKFIPFALALYNKESNGIQLLFSRCTVYGIGRWAILNTCILFAAYKTKWHIQETRRWRKIRREQAVIDERFQKDIAAWKANGREIPYVN